MKRRHKDFLRWIHERGGQCCLCGRGFEQLHHMGTAGMGQRGSDLVVCRLCARCHEKHGQRIHSLQRDCKYDILTAMLLDMAELLEGYDATGSLRG